MVSLDQIEELGQRIGREFHAHRVVLFGSYAGGAPTDDSDVDLLVVAETPLPPRKRYGAVRRLGGRGTVTCFVCPIAQARFADRAPRKFYLLSRCGLCARSARTAREICSTWNNASANVWHGPVAGALGSGVAG